MLVSAINTVEIHAASGRCSEISAGITRMLDVLNNSTPCIAYTLTPNNADATSWIVSGYWRSEAEMQAHFSHPELDGFMTLLLSGAISRLQFNSFVVAASKAA
ncbi:antibiotic biosynthesis monooxygenase [Pseudomonas sp. Pseu.R1]|uniref:antibiotic biosynthesis monooxygenase n=1 Tax=Pseudomonas sp. Pseu.R1 TaxID=3379818 RepID=UPI003B928A31